MRTWHGNIAFLKYRTANQSCVTKYSETHLSHSCTWLRWQRVSPPSTSSCVAPIGGRVAGKKQNKKKTQIKIEEQTVLSSDNSWSSPSSALTLQEKKKKKTEYTATPAEACPSYMCATDIFLFPLRALLGLPPLASPHQFPRVPSCQKAGYEEMSDIIPWQPYVTPERVSGGNPLREEEEEGCLNRKQNTVLSPLSPAFNNQNGVCTKGGHLAGSNPRWRTGPRPLIYHYLYVQTWPDSDLPALCKQMCWGIKSACAGPSGTM